MELINNDDEGDNINRNLLNNNNNNINNNNNNNNNENERIRNMIRNRNNNLDDNNEEQPENLFINKYTTYTFSFSIILFINIVFWIYSKLKNVEQYKFVFDMDSIVTHKQYYRCITRYFIHFGFGHLFLDLIISYFLLYLFENIYGTLLAISFIIISMLINSLIQLLLTLLLFNIFFHLNIIDFTTLHYEGGFGPILFALNTYICSFNNNYLNDNNFPIYYGNASYSSFYALVIIAFLSPNRSFIGNISGIITSYFIRYFVVSFLPKISWIIGLEFFFGLNRNFKENRNYGVVYRYITMENIVMKNILNQIDDNCINELEKEKKENNNNDINNINDNENNKEEQKESIEMSLFQNNENNRNN